MEKLLDELKEYLKNTPESKVQKDMDELDKYNDGISIKLNAMNEKMNERVDAFDVSVNSLLSHKKKSESLMKRLRNRCFPTSFKDYKKYLK